MCEGRYITVFLSIFIVVVLVIILIVIFFSRVMCFGVYFYLLSQFTYLEQKNPDGQTMLASTLIPQPHSINHTPHDEETNMSFGRWVLLPVLFWYFNLFLSYVIKLVRCWNFISEFVLMDDIDHPSRNLTKCFENLSCSMLLQGLTWSESVGDLEVITYISYDFNS